MNIGPTELIIVVGVVLPIVLIVWSFVDMAHRPGTRRWPWGLGMVAAYLVAGAFLLGWVVPVIYLVWGRHRLAPTHP
jgi:hypothetical protein